MAPEFVVSSSVEDLKEEDILKGYVLVGADNPIVIIWVRDSSCIQSLMLTNRKGISHDPRRRYSKLLLSFCHSTNDMLAHETVHRICTVSPIT